MTANKSEIKYIEYDDNSHGGDRDMARQRFGRRRFLDLSVNINPWGPPWRAWLGMFAGLSSIRHYPQPYAMKGRGQLASFFHLDGERIVLGNGAAELISILALYPDFRRALVLEPTFSEYRRSFAALGKPVIAIPFTPGFTLPLTRIGGELRQNDLLFICQPNNPTGRLFPEAELLQIIEAAHTVGAWVVMDESFLWFGGDLRRLSFSRFLDRFPKLILVNSLTKIGAVPGLRLGFLIGDSQLTAFCRGILSQWNLNVSAQRVIPAILNRRFLQRSVQRIQREKEWLIQHFALINEVEMLESAANFYLVQLKTAGIEAKEIINKLGKRGILVRDGSGFSNLPPDCFRVAVGRRGQNRRFLRTLKEIVVK
jgi:threonine-phosphate decarboxylase